MKDDATTEHSAGVEAALRPAGHPLDVRAIHAAHGDFVFACLQRFGVRDADLEDVMQEVLVVVHRKLDTYDATSRVTTWLYGIAMRVAAAHRRRAYVRRERPTDDVPEPLEPSDALSPEDALAMKQARARLQTILDAMDLERRAVFVMYEVEEMSCDEIAKVVGVPVGTVHSRLFKARKEMEAAIARWTLKDAGGKPR